MDMLIRQQDVHMSKRAKLFVATVYEAADSIQRYQEKIYQSEQLQERMPYARVWYALPSQSGWIFAPSKWTGYLNLSEGQYLDKETPMDGRKTEARLAQWFNLVADTDPQHENLRAGLRKFLGQFGREPSKVARVSLPKTASSVVATTDTVPQLIARLIKALEPAQREEVLSALA